MVVLTEEFHGLSLKRKGGHEAGLFDDAGAGFSLSCRATKMRRLACPDGPRDSAVAAAWEEDDVAMGDDGEKAVVVYGDGGDTGRRQLDDAPRLALRGEWIRDMLREADSRTVRELLAAAQAQERGSEPGLALAVVPWVPPAPTSGAAEEEGDASEEPFCGEDGEAAMDVEGDDEREKEKEKDGRPWTGHGYGGPSAAAGEGFVAHRWPQHCWAPAQVPAVAQASPVMWSW